MRGRAGAAGDRETAQPAAGKTPEERPRETAPSPVYDLEEEMQPENTHVDSTDLVDEIEPLLPDTVTVEEVAAERPGARYDLGYRIQIFASAELPRAEAMRNAARAQTGYDAYIEYEGGLYKVRVGDFATRAAAAEARGKLVALYPDCWIVQTTVRQ